MKYRRAGETLQINYKFQPWYKRMWHWISRKQKPTAGNGDYKFVIRSADTKDERWKGGV